MTPENNRRGRPRAEVLNSLIREGSTSASAIKCKYCFRVFPREKSLQAHLRTHTGKHNQQFYKGHSFNLSYKLYEISSIFNTNLVIYTENSYINTFNYLYPLVICFGN